MAATRGMDKKLVIWDLQHSTPRFICDHAVPSVWSESVPVFNNLKSLAVKSDKDRGWPAIAALLRNCPHLQTLVVKGLVHHVTDKCGDVCDCISREDKGFSLTLCPVKVVKIHGFQGTTKEVAMIEHFLEYFPSLEEMVVVYCVKNNPTQLRNRLKLNRSQDCRFFFLLIDG